MSTITALDRPARAAQWSMLGKMTVRQAQQRYPDLCQEVRLLTGDPPDVCEPYLADTMADLARSEHVSIPALLWLIDHPDARKPLITLNPDRRRRPLQRFAMPLPAWDLTFELDRLHAEYAWLRYDRNAKTLFKGPYTRIVLVALKRGAMLPEHAVPSRVIVEAVAGQARLHTANGSVDLCGRQVVLLQAGLAYRIEALEECAFLLTISGPAGVGASEPPAVQVAAFASRPSDDFQAVDAVTRASLDSFPASDAPAWIDLQVGGSVPQP